MELSDLDADEIEMMTDDPEAFQEMIHELLHDEGDDSQKVDSEWWDDYEGSCPEDIDWEVK
jgi:hypothetical protein